MSKILLFNGASSSGKSTFIKYLQPKLQEPYFYYSSDKLVQAKILPEVDRAVDNEVNSWNMIRPKFFDGFHRSIKAFADAGNDIIVEHVIEKKEWFRSLTELLQNHKVYFIKVDCPIDELCQREIKRGDRYLGEGKSHIEEGVHTWSPYDLEIDTYNTSVEANIRRVIELISQEDYTTVFDKITAGNLISRQILKLASELETANLPYHFDGSTTLLMHGIECEIDDIDITVQWDFFTKAYKLFQQEDISEILIGTTPNFYFHRENIKIHILSSTENFLFKDDKDRRIVTFHKKKVWSKKIEFYRKHHAGSHDPGDRIDSLVDNNF